MKTNRNEEQDNNSTPRDKSADEVQSSPITPPLLMDSRHCINYASEIDEFHRQVEEKWRPVPDFLDSIQGNVDKKMRLTPLIRSSAIDSMFLFLSSAKAAVDTIFLSVSLLDRYLSLTPISCDKCYALISGCLLLAVKFEEIFTLDADSLCGNFQTLTKDMIISMEVDILQTLEFDVWSPNAHTFLWITPMSEMYSSDFDKLCEYLALLSMLDYSCVQFLPSIVAASVVFLANFIINPNTRPWSKSLASGARYTPIELKDCVLRLHFMHQEGRSNPQSPGKNIRSKYQKEALLASEPKIPDVYFRDSDD